VEGNQSAVPVTGVGSPARDRVTAIATSTWTLGILVFALTWGGGLAQPLTPSIDHSLHAGLQMAADRSLTYGSDFVFTYGPLGFLKSYLVFVDWPSRLAGVYGLLLHLALCISLVWAIRRNFGVVIAVGLALVTASLARGDLAAAAVRDDASVTILALIWCLAALERGSPNWVRLLVIFGGGSFAAIESLAKLNTGIVVLAMVVLTVAAIDTQRWRNLAMLAATFFGSVTVLWFASGQGFGNIGEFIQGSLEVASGYSSGARLDFGWQDRGYDYVLAPVVMLLAAGIAWISAQALALRPRIAALAITVIVLFTAAKGGFVSHEIYHMGTFYPTVLGVCLAFRLPANRPAIRWSALGATVFAAAASFTAAFIPGYPLVDPVENVRNGVETIATLVDGDRLDAEIAGNRDYLIAEYDVPPDIIEDLEGHTVAIDPSEIAAAWAYELDWQPLPVIQPYVAWNEALDQRNADALASPEGPERVLREDLNALGRFPGYESPAAMISMLCNFKPEATSPKWLLLERAPDRCGEIRSLGTEEGTYGTPIEIPAASPGEAVFARVHGIQVAGLERLRTALVRAKGRQVRFGEDDQLFTLIEGTAADGLLMRVPPDADFPGAFALAPDSDTVTFLLEGGAADDPLSVDFFAMPISRLG
jgi:hypothetical protein